MDRPPRPHPRSLSVEKPKPLPPNASDREFALWCANLAAQCVHNWNMAQSWFEMFSAQLKERDEVFSEFSARIDQIERRLPPLGDEIPPHTTSRDLHEMREKAASIHDIEEVLERVVEKNEGRGNVNSERVREITETVVTKRGYDELSLSARERKQFYLAVVLAVIAAVLGAIGGRVWPH